jgi:vancomycin resistance protein YoaR
MTARSDPLAIRYSASASRVPWRRGGFTFLLTIVAIVVFAASFAVGYARIHDGRVLPGVEVSGHSLAGLSRTEATSKIREELPSLSGGQLVVNVGDTQQAVAYKDFGRDYDLELMLDQAFALGRGANFVEQLQEQLRILLNGVTVAPAVTWDNEALAAQVAEIAYAAQWDPVEASITRVDGRYVVSPSAEGQSTDVETAVADAMAVVNNTESADTAVTIHTAVIEPAIHTAEAQTAVDLVERVVGSDLTVSGAELSTAITSDTLRGWARLEESPAGGDWQMVVERDPVAQFVSNYAYQTDIPPKNATFGFVSGDISVVPSVDGRAADVEATTDGIMAAIEARANGGSAPSATLALAAVSPTFTTSDAQAISSRVTKLSEWTTIFSPSTLNGNGVNIQIPTSIIDGYVVEPGAMFDFLAVIGPITSPPYTTGAAIVHNRTVADGVLGGGMCSCSTTLFNAAMRAGLDIRARRNHSYYITRYPVGLDATVWIASRNSKQTMSFVNDNQYPVLIRGINRPGEVTFELYGVDDGRTVELSEPRVENAKAANEFYEYTDGLAPGVKQRVEYSVNGFDSWVTRIVRDASGAIIHEDEFKSNYKTITGIIAVGRYPGDPRAGTQVTPAAWRARHSGTAESPTP